MIASQELIEEIEKKRTKILDNPEYYSLNSNRIYAELRHMGDVHSYWMETPELRLQILEEAGVVTPDELKEKAREGILRVKRGWKHLESQKQNGNEEYFYFSPKTILEIGQLIEPFKNYKGFRQSHIKFGLEHVPSSPLLIQEQLRRFCNEMKYADSYHPVERAALAQLNFAEIQPFEDGNKRTGRLFQDRILRDYGLPPAVIPYGERALYKDALKYGLSGLKSYNPKKMRAFIDLIGGKVNSALDEILGDLNIQ